MKFLKDLKEGDRVFDIYLCKHKQAAVTKNGKAYDNVILQDKTGVMDAKVWDPNSEGIDEYDALDYIEVYGEVNSFNGALQINVKRIRRCQEGEYNPADYLPLTPYSIDDMYTELLGFINSVKNEYLNKLLNMYFVENEAFISAFKKSSAAKSVHHSFVGGLLQHTLSVTKMCDYYCSRYEMLNHDLLITAAICHDIGKTRELSLYPENDYTDVGQYVGHIVLGSEMVQEYASKIPGFPNTLLQELKHCILAHHGELEFGSPKKPALIEAVALNFADNTDAKLQTFTEILENTDSHGQWMGYNRLFESNLHATYME